MLLFFQKNYQHEYHESDGWTIVELEAIRIKKIMLLMKLIDIYGIDKKLDINLHFMR